MRGKRKMIDNWSKANPQVDMNGDNNAEGEFRCARCNSLSNKTQATLLLHEANCPCRHKKTVSKTLQKKVGERRTLDRLKSTNEVTIAEKQAPQKLHVKYLGSLVSHDGTSDAEVTRRIGLAQTKFNRMKYIAAVGPVSSNVPGHS